MQMRKERGITLLALVVTIIILIILATVSINIVVEDGGVFTKAEQAKYAYEMSEVQQRFDMAILEVKTKNKGQAPVDKYIEHLKEKGIIEPESEVTNPDGSIEVTTPDGWVAQIEKDGDYVKRVVVEGKADNLPVRITNVQLTPTTHDITVKLTVLRGEKAKYSYYYKQGAITDEEKSLSGEELVKEHNWKKAADKTESLEIVIGDDIEQAQQYTVMVEAIEGNVVQSRGYATARTTEVPIATGAIEFGELSWENGLPKVTVSKTTEDYHLQYQVVKKDEMPVNDKWNTLEDKAINSKEVTELDLGQVIVARLWDGYKGGASISSFEVKDEIAPTINVTSKSSTTSTVSVTVSVIDLESGMGESPDYTYSIRLKNGSYGVADTTESTSHTFTELNQKTEYIVKIETADRAKNKQIKEMTGENEIIKTGTVPDGGNGTTGAIKFEDAKWANKKQSVNITKTDTNYQLQYQTVKNGKELNNNGWTTEQNKATNLKNITITGLELGDKVVARLWDGRQGGNTATFTVKDEKEPNAATINLNNVTNIKKGGTINATVTHRDGESGIDIGKCKWILHTQQAELGTADSSYTTSSFVHGTFSAETQTLKNAITTEGTYYLHVLSVDMTGTNKKETVSGAITVKTPTVAESKGVTQSTTTTIPDSLGNNVVVPGGFKIANDSGKNVEEGIVIEDDSGNQFVWIPVSNIDGDNNESNGITGTPIKTSKGDKEITLGRYTFATTSPGTPTLVQRGSEHANRNKEYKIPEYEYQEITTNERTNGGQGAKNLAEFVKSVQDNHGYYLARYEAGKGTDGKPVSKAGAVWNNITQPEASAEAQKMYEEKDYTSDLVNSYTWDTAIVYIQAMGNDNYANTTNPKSSNMNTGETGNEKCHIFDMAGNVAEWTTEYSTGASLGGNCPYVFRGGYYDYYLKKVYPAYRWRISLYENVDYVGFRPILYLK